MKNKPATPTSALPNRCHDPPECCRDQAPARAETSDFQPISMRLVGTVRDALAVVRTPATAGDERQDSRRRLRGQGGPVRGVARAEGPCLDVGTPQGMNRAAEIVYC
jgi:hypothetical protein